MNKTNRIFVAASLSVIAAITAGCSSQSRAGIATVSAATVEIAIDPTLLEVRKPEQFKLTEVLMRSVQDELLVNGVVAPDVSRTVPVNALTGGRVVEIKARLGDEVTKGQLLLRIGSTDVAMAISDYKKFQADEDLSRRALDRAKALLDRGAIAQKEMETAESVNAKSKVDVATSEERIRLLGGDPKRLVSILDITAPVSGTIVEQNVTHSAGVKSFDNSPNLFTIADLSKVWVLCDVYENNISQVHLNDYAEVRTNAYRDRVVRGRVSNIGTMLDPASRTLKVRLELDNQDGYMRPGMFAAARFLAQGAVSRMGLPATAILRLHDRDWVFLPAGDGKFRRTEVQTGGQLKDGFQEILAGIKPGQRVVASALQFSSAAESR